MDKATRGPLAGLRVLDLSRVLAGPWASQILGDLGAEVIKIEQPGKGDDTRSWGPPFLDDNSGDSAYYLACNRNKRALAVDLATPEGSAIVRRLALASDIVIENFRAGGLAKFGLDHASLLRDKPSLIYCSITGFGQDGPYRDRGGYDFLIQGMSGLMSVTGRPDGEPGAGPLKSGIPVSDLFTGLYAVVSILSSLNDKVKSGMGQHLDCSLFDVQVSLLTNQASNYLNGGVIPRRLGNQHPNVVPYQDFETKDGSILVALGNDRQFRDFCGLLGRQDLAQDPMFASSAKRSVHREPLVMELQRSIRGWKSNVLLTAMEAAHLPGGPVNSVEKALSDQQTEARGLVQSLERADGTVVKALGYPVRFSRTPAIYATAPPRLGEDTHEILQTILGFDDTELQRLEGAGVIYQAGKRQIG
jgi:crotonobetainyl-CoA:carnitine CoA-transferase CaiB-like acyl-CoA transferase